jgi:ubiquinone/menaquinone biosynthesis C-methylase UbiE
MDRQEVTASLKPNKCVPLEVGFQVPNQDLCTVLQSLGCKLFTRERTLSQYVFWSVREGLFRFLGERGTASVPEVSANTSLTERGADSILGVLAALQLVSRSPTGQYQLTDSAREYFLEESPYYIGHQLRPVGYPIPGTYLRQTSSILARVKLWLLLHLHPSMRFGSTDRIENQHARNLSACAAAVRSGEFTGIRCLVDIAGGSGAFSIPFALDYPSARIVMTDLPAALRRARTLLNEHGLSHRIELTEMDAFQYPWKIPQCDGLFIGNFLHAFGDETCVRVCRECFDRLQVGGQLWIHEMLWNDTKDGPLITALWHAAMRIGGSGMQRTAAEISSILTRAGFSNIRLRQTSGAYALIRGEKLG